MLTHHPSLTKFCSPLVWRQHTYRILYFFQLLILPNYWIICFSGYQTPNPALCLVNFIFNIYLKSIHLFPSLLTWSRSLSCLDYATIYQLVSHPSYWHSLIPEIDVTILDHVIPLLKTQVLSCTLKIQTKDSDPIHKQHSTKYYWMNELMWTIKQDSVLSSVLFSIYVYSLKGLLLQLKIAFNDSQIRIS